MATYLNNMTPSNHLIHFVTYNLHGFNQGISYLDYLCSTNVELILLQETWLNDDAFSLMLDDFSEKYILFCSSPMNACLSTGILKGRPFGGLGILMRKEFYNAFRSVECLVLNLILFVLKQMKY